MEKYIKDGKVGVLVSPGFGAGWSTWADSAERETALMDKRLVEAALSGNVAELRRVADELCPESYKGGLDDVIVEWVPVGGRFRIDEYDGSESLVAADDRMYQAWLAAWKSW
jgi:hypothetical protein